jgi:hypothetical protein
MKAYLRAAAGLIGGVLLGVFFHYLLHRISLPQEPFIYFSF